MDKKLAFDYMITLFAKWHKEITKKDDAITNTFTKLSLLKLLFLTAATKNDEGDDLLKVFDNFFALPYGPVESDVYNAMNDDALPNYTIQDRAIFLKNNTFTKLNLNNEDQIRIKKSVDKIKSINPNLVTYNAFDLVEITHQWNSWISAYKFAQLIGQQAYEMTTEEIKNDRNKFYGYIPQL